MKTVFSILLLLFAGCSGKDVVEIGKPTVTYSETKIDTVYVTHVKGIYSADLSSSWRDTVTYDDLLSDIDVYGVTNQNVKDTVVLSTRTVVVKTEEKKPNTMYFRAMRDSTVNVPDVSVRANWHVVFGTNSSELLARLQKNIGKRVVFEYTGYYDRYLRVGGNTLETVTFLDEDWGIALTK